MCRRPVGPTVLGLFGAALAAVGAAFWLRKRGRGGAARIRVADVMTRHPRTIRPDGTVAEAASMMRSLDVGSLPVCDGSRLVGMLSDRDIAVRSTADGRDPLTTYVRGHHVHRRRLGIRGRPGRTGRTDHEGAPSPPPADRG